jgi:hypothetical protein
MTWTLTNEPPPRFMCARNATAKKERSTGTNHAKPRGDNNVRQLSKPSARQSETLRGLRETVWSHSVLLLANAALFKEVPRSPRGPPGDGPQMVMQVSSRLSTIAARITHKTHAVRQFATQSMCDEPSMQTSPMELSLLPIGDNASPSARRWTRARCPAPSSAGSIPA